MSELHDRLEMLGASAERGSRARAFAGALLLTIVGSVLSLVVYMLFRPAVTGLLEPSFPALGALVLTKGSQVGFALIVGAYLGLTRRWDEYVQLRWPSLHDLLWVVLGTAGLDLMAEASQLVLPLLGLSIGLLSGTGSGGLDVGLETWPVLWPLVFLALYLLPALAEEGFIRGIVQGRLRDTFHPVWEVVLGAGLFALMHGLYGVGRGPEFLAAYLVLLFGQGLAFCLTYERTRNLLVVAAVHALSWTEFDALFFGLF
ncbi:CPBP family intramembrane glutamic endopeptidase [Halorarum halobium]|uniref:CPBP family intramembrane glutamic endopeptidase n=1 Tax=Halorarum halobium TaxID=3075121 RepID=UPI0028ABF5FE|nr:CPBP family intramembrane glutamic endopeptidase [Halobaculum sp. XH14]